MKEEADRPLAASKMVTTWTKLGARGRDVVGPELVYERQCLETSVPGPDLAHHSDQESNSNAGCTCECLCSILADIIIGNTNQPSQGGAFNQHCQLDACPVS